MPALVIPLVRTRTLAPPGVYHCGHLRAYHCLPNRGGNKATFLDSADNGSMWTSVLHLVLCTSKANQQDMYASMITGSILRTVIRSVKGK